jgi:hypothetical protein
MEPSGAIVVEVIRPLQETRRAPGLTAIKPRLRRRAAHPAEARQRRKRSSTRRAKR